MKIKIAILTVLVASLTIGGGYNPAPVYAPEDCDLSLGTPMVKGNYQNSVRSYQEQLCAAAGTGIITYTEWIDGITPTSRAADASEVEYWDSYVEVTDDQDEVSNAYTSLASEVENGKKIVELLNEWSVTYDGYYDQWPTLSAAQKDNASREHLRHFSVLLSKLADLYVVSDHGR